MQKWEPTLETRQGEGVSWWWVGVALAAALLGALGGLAGWPAH